MFYRHAKIEPSSRNGDASSGLLFIYNLITSHKFQIKKEKCTRLGVIKGGFYASSPNEKFSTSVQQTCSLIVNFHSPNFFRLIAKCCSSESTRFHTYHKILHSIYMNDRINTYKKPTQNINQNSAIHLNSWQVFIT